MLTKQIGLFCAFSIFLISGCGAPTPESEKSEKEFQPATPVGEGDLSGHIAQTEAQLAQSRELDGTNRPQPLMTMSGDEGIITMSFILDDGQVSSLAVGRGAGGLTIYNLKGDTLSTHSAPAHVVAYYQNRLVVLRPTDIGNEVERFGVNPQTGTLTSEYVENPSPLGATTLQRTAIAALGPARIEGNYVNIAGHRLPFEQTVTAIAAIRGQLNDQERQLWTAIALENGTIEVYTHKDLQRWMAGP